MRHRSTSAALKIGRKLGKISPDLTYADAATLNGEMSIIPNQNCQDYFATLFTVALSVQDPTTIWTGSDDGLIHITRDDGKNWLNVTPHGLPKYSRGVC